MKLCPIRFILNKHILFLDCRQCTIPNIAKAAKIGLGIDANFTIKHSTNSKKCKIATIICKSTISGYMPIIQFTPTITNNIVVLNSGSTTNNAIQTIECQSNGIYSIQSESNPTMYCVQTQAPSMFVSIISRFV